MKSERYRQAMLLQCPIAVGRAPIPGEMLSVAETLSDPAAVGGHNYVFCGEATETHGQ
jgi:hypothetical protein